MRKKIIGKKVHVKIDYMRQATEATAEQKGFPERACATVTFQGMTHHYENIITRVPTVDWSWSN